MVGVFKHLSIQSVPGAGCLTVSTWCFVRLIIWAQVNSTVQLQSMLEPATTTQQHPGKQTHAGQIRATQLCYSFATGW